MNIPLVLRTDSYKLSHAPQYPPNTSRVYSYFESRGGKFRETVFFGLQPILKEYLSHKITSEEVLAAEEFAKEHGEPFNKIGWEHIVHEHGGFLPLSIRAVPEGTVVPTHNVLMTVENTCDKCFWVTNWAETQLVRVWYPTTIATSSREMRKMLIQSLLLCGADRSKVDFMLHDFGARGVTCGEQASIGGAAHLLSFNGSDTMEGVWYAREMYGSKMAGFSIPAYEHSTVTSWGKDNELAAYQHALDIFPKGPVAVVSDSYDIYNAVEKLWGSALHDQVMARDGVLIIRPDSGSPGGTLRRLMPILWEKFGGTLRVGLDGLDYKIIDPHVRVIWGDGIDQDSLENILLEIVQLHRWGADNFAFRSGGGLLQRFDRDTCKFAFKCSAAKVDGAWRDVFKDPITDQGKKSKRGQLALVRDTSEWETLPRTQDTAINDELVEVFRDGKILKEYTFDEIRAKVREV